MAKQTNPNKKRSAYSDFLDETPIDELERDIAYFTKTDVKKARPKPRAATQPARRRVAPSNREESPRRAQREQEYVPSEQKLERAKKRKKQLAALDYRCVLIASFLLTLLIFALSLLTLATGDKQYSENENRYLAQRPALSAAALADGSFMKESENYLSDQFTARSAMVKFRTKIDLFFGKREINDVYIGKDHFLFEKPSELNSKALKKTLGVINNFSSQHKKINTYVAIAPDASQVLSELMPKNAPTQDQAAQIKTIYNALNKNIKCIDICSTLQNCDDKQSLYYRTDHHWTTTGAEIAFKQIAANMKLNTGKVDYESFPVSNSFRGTLASSSGLFHAKDVIQITVPKTDVKYVVSYTDENKKSASMFDSEKLKQKNQYEVFFGGNFGEVHINTTLNSKKVLLVFKDSYANCLVPMLMPYYKSIIMVDPRYYGGDINRLVKDEAVTDILWLYNANTFLSDTSIQSKLQ